MLPVRASARCIVVFALAGRMAQRLTTRSEGDPRGLCGIEPSPSSHTTAASGIGLATQGENLHHLQREQLTAEHPRKRPMKGDAARRAASAGSRADWFPRGNRPIYIYTPPATTGKPGRGRDTRSNVASNVDA